MSAEFLDLDGLNHFLERLEQTYSSGVLFQITIAANAWNDLRAIVYDERAIPNKEYVYFTSVEKTGRNEYLFSGVHPEDVTINGEFSFTASVTPASNLIVNILRLKVK